MNESPTAPVLFDDDPLAYYWPRPVSQVATLAPASFTAGQAERHRIFSLALMSLIEHYFNGNTRGLCGTYAWRDKQAWPGNPSLWLNKPPATPVAIIPPTEYMGHNIAAIAVDGNGEIIDFEFNHNEVLDSSVEHAEARLIRRVFSLARIGDGWKTDIKPIEPDYSTRLTEVTVYSSLESCAQCSGIMMLGRVKEVVYLQKDNGASNVGNILYQLTHKPPGDGAEEQKYRTKPVAAPLPIPANEFGLAHYTALDTAYREFFRDYKLKPFFNGKTTRSVASFLCTDLAYDIFKRGSEEFAALKVQPPAPDEKPPQGLTNAQALEAARRFIAYAKEFGGRGTGH